MKALPFVARRVLDMLQREETSIAELCGVIEKDQNISTRVLRVSNSALYGVRQEVTSLRQATMLLGFNNIKDIVLGVTTKSLFKTFGITEQMMWDHSVGAAIAAKRFSGGGGKELAEVAFLGGLMHDFGKVVMNNETPDLYRVVMMKVFNEGYSSMRAEEEVYGFTHAAVGSKVLELWGFPPIYVTMLARHHAEGREFAAITDMATARAVACINLADYACKALGIGYRSPEKGLELDRVASAAYLSFTKDDLVSLLNEISASYEAEKAAFN
jgi:HD-like signal output (HDOD) protein